MYSALLCHRLCSKLWHNSILHSAELCLKLTGKPLCCLEMRKVCFAHLQTLLLLYSSSHHQSWHSSFWSITLLQKSSERKWINPIAFSSSHEFIHPQCMSQQPLERQYYLKEGREYCMSCPLLLKVWMFLLQKKLHFPHVSRSAVEIKISRRHCSLETKFQGSGNKKHSIQIPMKLYKIQSISSM